MLSRLKVASLAVALVSVNTWATQTANAQGAGPQPGAGAEPQTPPSAEPVEQKPPPGEAVSAPSAATPKPKTGQVEEILVTGSRIRRMDLTTAAPVTVLGKDQMEASGKVSIGDFLQSLPEQSNAINTAVNNGGDGSTRVNLRGLGSNRTLVLVNGRRMVPGGTGADSSADLNSIPTAAIERVEVLKDGASAVYGSDAVAGVVNLITRRDWNGTELNAFAGTSTHADGTLYDLNVTTGMAGDRGSFIFSGGFYKQSKVMAGDRNFSKIPLAYDATIGQYTLGSGTIPAGRFVLAEDQFGIAVPNPTNDPRINLYNELMAQCTETDRTNCPSSYIHDSSVPLGWRPFKGAELPVDGGDGYNFQPDNYLVTPQQRIQLYATGDTKFGTVARGYFEASYVNRQSDQLLASEPLLTDLEGVTVSADSIYNPFGVDLPAVRRRLVEFGNRRTQQDVDTVRAVGGVDGTLGTELGLLAGWFWDVSLNYGRNMSTQLNEGNLRLPPLQNAVGPSFIDPATGQPTCGTPEAPIPNCVPLDLLHGVGTITPDMIRGLTYTGTQRGYNQLVSVQANVSGELFSLAADRPVGLAIGYEYRDLSGAQIPDPITVAGETSGNKGEITSGAYHVNEGYGELSVPIVSGMPGIEDLEVTVAARVFDYSNFGGDWTYKGGARWKIIPDVTVRGTYSTAFRAPDISDLYLGQTDNFAPLKDPCRLPTGPASCGSALGNGDDQSQLRSRWGGNPNLKPETAKIFTAGIVLEPTFLEGFSVTVDYYHISMDKLISTIGESVILSGCYPGAGATPKYCDLITRDPTTHRILNIMNLNQNVGSLVTAGVDLSLRYAIATEVGRFGLSFDGTWLDKYDVTQADGTVIHGKDTFDLAASGVQGVYPAIRFNAGVAYSLGGLAAGVNMRFVSSWKECGDETGDFAGYGLCYVQNLPGWPAGTPHYSRTVGAYQMYDLFLSYALEVPVGKTVFGLGVNNVFDRAPEKIYNGFLAASDPTAYDFMGRYFYGRIVQTF